jgi:epoxyqueuosine reductase
MNLKNGIFRISKLRGIDHLGFADLTPAHEFIRMQGGDSIADYPRCVSIGIALPDSIVDLLPHRNEKAVSVSYRHHAYDVINSRLDMVASEISSLIQAAGFRTFPIPAAKRIDDERICASFSHKLGAHLAGLGWIGKSCLLVTPAHGPRVRWTSVLTDAPVPVSARPEAGECGNCVECVNACPVGAFTGRQFFESEQRESRYDARKCESYFEEMEDKGRLPVCGMCLYVCPYGKRS